MLNMIKVSSSNIKAVGYYKGNLYVDFMSGLYEYVNVPKNIYEELVTAESKGKYLIENIRGKYNYKKVVNTDGEIK